MIERTTVRLPKELLERAKSVAADKGHTLTAMIEHGLRLALAEEAKPKGQKRRVLLPVSKATGWLKPGIDLSDIQEMEDMEYAERLKRGFK